MQETQEAKGTYDFIGEVARDLGTYRDVFTYLKNTFPELKERHSKILSNLEANCFSHGKKGDINPAMAIMNLKANYGWTDRIDTTSKSMVTNVTLTAEEAKEIAKGLKDEY
jgi:hypothetical protein